MNNTLSQPAQKLYEYLQFKLNGQHAPKSVSMSDETLSFRVRIPINQIYGAQVELARLGRVHIEPGATSTKYELENEDNYLSGVQPLHHPSQ
jgi:hypothetical protein